MHIARRYSPPPPDPYPLPSIRLVILCVSVAVALSMIVVILLIDVRPPPLADIFLTPAYFPLGQSLQMKIRRWTRNEKSCVNYGVPKFNSSSIQCEKGDASKLCSYSSDHPPLCGQAIWQSSAEQEEGDRYVNKIETIYRFFSNENLTSEYFLWYIASGAFLPLSLDKYSNESAIAPQAGELWSAFKWDPDTNKSKQEEQTKEAYVGNHSVLNEKNSSTDDADSSVSTAFTTQVCSGQQCRVFRHTVYVFKLNNAFARLVIHGFNNSKDQRLGVDFAGRLAGIMVDLIAQNQPSSLDAFIISFQSWVRYFVRTLPLALLNKGYNGLFSGVQIILSLFNGESWVTIFELLSTQLRLLWQHLLYASVNDLYFLIVAVLLLFLHKTQIYLAPYKDMNNVHTKCSCLLTTAIEKTRRHAEAVKDEIIVQT